jgi:hypothetical protein
LALSQSSARARPILQSVSKNPSNYFSRRFSLFGLLGSVNSRRPKKQLIPVLVQNPQAIGVLRHVQSPEERFGFHLCALQIRRDVRNSIECGVRVVFFSNAEELNRKTSSRHLHMRK